MEKSKSRKSYLIVAILLLLVLVSLGIGFVVAYNTIPAQPSFMGHSFGEIDWACNIVINNTNAQTTYATCATGDKLVSGGCSVLNGLVAYNRPLLPNTWRCSSKDTLYNATAFALCCH